MIEIQKRFALVWLAGLCGVFPLHATDPAPEEKTTVKTGEKSPDSTGYSAITWSAATKPGTALR